MAEQPDPGIRVPVALEAPCGRCEKADVCSLRPTVEALRSLPVLAPALDRRLGLELAGAVSCSAFVKARIRKADPGELEPKGRKLNLTAEERERRRQSALDMVERQRQARAGTAA